MKNKQETEIAYGYCEYKMKALLIKVGFCDAFVWLLNTNEVREVVAMANINLNKTQSLNGALRAVYMEEGGDFVALGGGVRNQPYLLFPHTYGL